MEDFFKPRRRKLGCVSLVATLMVMGGWLRSQYWIDSIIFNLNGQVITIQSLANGIDFGRMSYRVGLSSPGWEWSSQELLPLLENWVDAKGNQKEIDPWMDHKIVWRRDWFGFHVGVGYRGNRRDEDCMIPYWSIVVPLTLLSAYLLLTKPRIVKLKTNVENNTPFQPIK